jgi:hypothetical protein
MSENPQEEVKNARFISEGYAERALAIAIRPCSAVMVATLSPASLPG